MPIFSYSKIHGTTNINLTTGHLCEAQGCSLSLHGEPFALTGVDSDFSRFGYIDLDGLVSGIF